MDVIAARFFIRNFSSSVTFFCPPLRMWRLIVDAAMNCLTGKNKTTVIAIIHSHLYSALKNSCIFEHHTKMRTGVYKTRQTRYIIKKKGEGESPPPQVISRMCWLLIADQQYLRCLPQGLRFPCSAPSTFPSCKPGTTSFQRQEPTRVFAMPKWMGCQMSSFQFRRSEHQRCHYRLQRPAR